MKSTLNIVLVGPMGAGKTSIGKRLAEALSLAFVDADHVIEERTGVRIVEIFEHEGEAGFRRRESAVLAELLTMPGQLLATGGGVVLAAENRRLLASNGLIVHLDVGVDEQLKRLAKDRQRPLLQRPDRETVLREMAKARGPLYAEVAHLHLCTDGLSPAQASQRLLAMLSVQHSTDIT